MPDRIQNALLNRPTPNPFNKDVELPEGDPNAPEEQIMRFFGSMMGREHPAGDPAGTAGELAGMIGPGKILAGAKGAALGLKGLAGLKVAPMAGMMAVPPKTAKEFGRLIGELIEDPNIRRAWKSLQARYPRTMGHTRELITQPTKSGAHGVNHDFSDLSYLRNEVSENPIHHKDITLESPVEKLKKQSVIQIDPGSTMPPEATLGHELQHTAHRLMGGKDFESNYAKMNEMHGYYNNPFEIAARKREDAETVRAMGFPKFRNLSTVPTSGK